MNAQRLKPDASLFQLFQKLKMIALLVLRSLVFSSFISVGDRLALESGCSADAKAGLGSVGEVKV